MASRNAPIFLLGVMLMASGSMAAAPDLSGILPDDVRGWRAGEPDGLYDATTLYGYIDGGAEVYLALDVRKVRARRYVNGDQPEIIADLFRMGSPADAFGAFHHDIREGEDAGIGAESEYADGALAFWKGPFFVSILALDESPEIEKVVMEIGKSIASNIKEEGGPPELLKQLPEKEPVPGSVKYFHTHLSLGRYHPLGDDNLLGLDMQTEGIVARYRNAAGEFHSLILIRYPSEKRAGEAREAYRSKHAGEARTSGAILRIVPDAPSER